MPRTPRPIARTWLAPLALAFALAGPAGRAEADVAFDVSLDTSSLVANPGEGPYALDFTLIGTQGNTVTISDVQFGAGGAAGGTIVPTGGATGDLSSGVVLDDSAHFFNDFNQTFTPGALLTFHVVATTAFVGLNPDNFSVSLLTGDGNAFPTTDAASSTLMFVDLTGPSPDFSHVFEADTSLKFADGTPVFPLAEPTITPTPVPEPSSLALVALGLAGLARFRRGSKSAGRAGAFGFANVESRSRRNPPHLLNLASSLLQTDLLN